MAETFEPLTDAEIAEWREEIPTMMRRTMVHEARKLSTIDKRGARIEHLETVLTTTATEREWSLRAELDALRAVPARTFDYEELADVLERARARNVVEAARTGEDRPFRDVLVVELRRLLELPDALGSPGVGEDLVPQIRKLKQDCEGLRGHRDGLYRVFHALARDDRAQLAQVDEMIQQDVDAIVDLRIELASVRRALFVECKGCQRGWPIIEGSTGVHQGPQGQLPSCPFSEGLRAIVGATRISAKGLGPL